MNLVEPAGDGRIGPHAELTFAQSRCDGELMVEPVPERDWKRIAALVEV